MKDIGTPLQAIKFVMSEFLAGGESESFLNDWLDGDVDSYGDEYKKFCADNPDEPEHVAKDGSIRKQHYGPDRQPIDDIEDAGWGPAFCAGNALKYVRRAANKNGADDLKKGRWYYAR